MVVGCGAVYGFAMGMFSLDPLQGLYSAIKVPMFLGVTTLVCLPSMFVLHTILGLREDFGLAYRAVLASQAALTVGLASMTPVLLWLYSSTSDYATAVFSNGVLFAIATVGAQAVTRREYAPLIARNPRHRGMRRAFSWLYVFVAIQLAWVLRPFIGFPGADPQFFRDEAWSNAYVVVADLVWRMVG